jgi:hypothetical protein
MSALEGIDRAAEQRSGLTTVPDWLRCLDEIAPGSDCSLHTPIFMDLPAHLTSLPSSDLEEYVTALLDTATRLSRAQEVLDRLLAW